MSPLGLRWAAGIGEGGMMSTSNPVVREILFASRTFWSFPPCGDAEIDAANADECERLNREMEAKEQA